MSTPRNIYNQYNAGVQHMKAMSSFINKEEGSNTREEQKKRKEVVKTLSAVKGYSGSNKVFAIFKSLIFAGNH
jgi:hypothetical protein